MASLRDVLEFETEGFHSVILSETEDTVHFRLNVKSDDEFQLWKELYMKENNTCLNVKRSYPCKKWNLFHKTFVCLHGDARSKGRIKTYTGYVLFMYSIYSK